MLNFYKNSNAGNIHILLFLAHFNNIILVTIIDSSYV